ncbi:unnamed protein product [Prunus brigantina]
MGLTGTIPPHLGNLSFLLELRLRNNSFHASDTTTLWEPIHRDLAPSPNLKPSNCIFNLSSLQVTNLNNNQLSGSIPREIANLTMLKEINLDYNKFEEIPNEISIIELRFLWMQFNALKGHVTDVVFNTSSLKNLALSRNNLNGSLPVNISQHLSIIQGLYLPYK